MREFTWNDVAVCLDSVYGSEASKKLVVDVQKLFANFQEKKQGVKTTSAFLDLNEKDLALICYANQIESAELNPIQTLGKFLKQNNIPNYLPITHLLPFFPWDTDRGFSVKDYYQVDPDYGDWNDIAKLGEQTKLMFDFVANHASIDNPLVQKALIAEHLKSDHPDFAKYHEYLNYVVTYSEANQPTAKELENLSRPRAFPVLTAYRVVATNAGLSAILGEVKPNEEVVGKGYVWTTFSRAKLVSGEEDTRQVDLNYQNPKVFLEALKIVLFYMECGSKLLRLDAIGYLWKRLGSTSLHEKECHQLLEAWNYILKIVAPELVTISEVNEPQDKAFTYIGTPENPEADLAYQFSHFPLAVHAVHFENAKYYQGWLGTIKQFGGHQFTTVLGSHDGLGLKPARGILPESELEKFSELLVEQHGGRPNFAILPGGKKIIYEICATPWDLINNPNVAQDFDLCLKKYLAVTAMGLCIPGIPAIYWNGLIGAKNYLPTEGLDENRTVNREVFNFQVLQSKLDTPTNEMAKIFAGVKELLKIRSNCSAFDPNAKISPVEIDSESLVACLLSNLADDNQLFALTNVSQSAQKVSFAETKLTEGSWIDLITKQEHELTKNSVISLAPYQVYWFAKA